jgi:hypothetical protein
LKFYADVHRSKRNDEGYRITYTTDGTAFKHVDSLGEIPAEPGDKLFMDTIPPQHTDGAIELLRRGVEVYYLRRLTLLRKMRGEHKLPKSARGDIKALMSIEERWFRRVTEDFLVMRRMITTYKTMTRTHQQLLNKYKALSETEKEVLRPVIKSLEVQMEEVARMIVEEAGKRYPAYNRLVDELGIRGNIKAQEALAELITYLDPFKGFRKTRNLLGLFKPIRGGRKIYSGHLRRALQKLTASANNIRTCELTAKKEKEILSRIWRTYRMEALGEAGHTGAGIKPGGRYDEVFNAHPTIGCCDALFNVRPPTGFPRCRTDGQATPPPSFPIRMKLFRGPSQTP